MTDQELAAIREWHASLSPTTVGRTFNDSSPGAAMSIRYCEDVGCLLVEVERLRAIENEGSEPWEGMYRLAAKERDERDATIERLRAIETAAREWANAMRSQMLRTSADLALLAAVRGEPHRAA